MGLTARYNGSTLPEGCWSISKTIASNENSAKQEISTVHRVDVDGHLTSTNSAGIESKFSLLAASYSVNYFDFLVFLPSGALSNRLSLLNAGSLSGVRVTQKPSLQSLENGQYVTYLPVKMSLEAEYISGLAIGALTAFNETLTFEGGGPVQDWYRPIKGTPTKGIVRQADTYRAVQAGSATGYLDYPRLGTNSGAPPPIFAIVDLNKNPQVTLTSPERQGSTFVNWTVSWSYEFESASPFFGTPHRWPLG